MKRISLIVPMYKVEAYLDRCLRSCLSQDIPEEDYEILAVDDQSPDSSAAIAASIAASHPCIRVLRQAHAGLSAARNLGLRNACGRYVWFIDSDDRIEENCLGKILETAEKQDLDILRISAADVRGGKSVRRFAIQGTGVVAGRTLVDEGRMQLCAPFSIFRKDFLTAEALVSTGIVVSPSSFLKSAQAFLSAASTLAYGGSPFVHSALMPSAAQYSMRRMRARG